MKGRLIKVNDDWFIDYIFGDWQTLLPVVGVFDGLNPGDEVEFEITSKYEGYDIPVIAILKDEKKINVLSLFDGMSCGQIALNKVGIEYKNYFASEIDKHAIKVTQHNYPDTIQLGSVTEIKGADLPQIDLLIGGSPCQSFSNAGNGTGFDGKSGLFYEYVRLLKECNPKYFLLENVKMKNGWQDIISKELGCKPIKINSNLVSAQNRERLYWTNIPILELEDKCIFIEDILDKEFENKYWLKERNTELLLKKVDVSNAPRIACIDVYNKKVKLDRKCPTLTLPHHNSIRLLQNKRIRKLTPNECEKLQNVPLNYTDCELSDIHRYSMLGNGWTVDVIAHILGSLLNGP